MNREGLSGGVHDPSSWIVPELLIRYVRAIYELNRCEPRLANGPASAQQIRALLYLVYHDGATIKGLAQALSVSEARASRLADELAHGGLILHQRDAIDRRVVRLHVAPAAAEMAQRMYRERYGALEAALADASEQELEIFARLLGRIVEEFETLARRTITPQPVALDVPVALDDLIQEPLPPIVADASGAQGSATASSIPVIVPDQGR
jgi:DNA-binding MarR family transcriptional regulator